MNFLLLYFIGVRTQVLTQCNSNNQVTLTFDDGPGDNTNKIVNILNENNVTATFFINGLRVIKENRWYDLKKLINNGNTLGTHTFSHVSLDQVNDFNINREFYDNELIFRLLLNKRPRFFRPPYFNYNDRILNFANTFGYTTVITNLDPLDWNLLNEDLIYQYFVTHLTDGSFITLNHEQVVQSVNVLDKVIKYIKTQNFSIVSIEECLGLSSYQNDNVYGPFLTNGINTNMFST